MSVALHAAVLPTPVGPLAVVVDPLAEGDRGPRPYGAVVACGFAPLAEVLARVPAAARLAPDGTERPVRSDPDLSGVAAAVRAWAAGDAAALDAVSVTQPGGPFQQAAWAALRAVPAGTTETYAGLAARAGRPGAVRAAGSACARNRVAPFVPCHRVVRSDGSAGGYAYGLAVKADLLRLEGVTVGWARVPAAG